MYRKPHGNYYFFYRAATNSAYYENGRRFCACNVRLTLFRGGAYGRDGFAATRKSTRVPGPPKRDRTTGGIRGHVVYIDVADRERDINPRPAFPLNASRPPACGQMHIVSCVLR